LTPLVIAHRGACWDAPENSLEAFELAIDQGADYVEFDVRAAPDGTLVLCHDPLPDPAPVGLCTLEEALQALRGRVGLAVEIKAEHAAAPTMHALRKQRINTDALMILSFQIRTLETARRLAPDVRMVLNLGLHPDPTAGGRYWGVGFDDSVARPGSLRRARSLGLATLVFTVNEPSRMRELAALGVDGIFSDRPRLLQETLAGLPDRERA
jgi:glycerophosphoryl diester phosphodiesterase